MKLNQIPTVTIILCVATIALSFSANFAISGTLFGKIRVVDLEPYGGLLPEHIFEFELWRLLVSNLVHAKQLHMLYNVLSLFLLGYFLESKVSSGHFFIIWLATGVAGNLAGYYTVPAPWGIGTGGSAANFGLAACATAFYISGMHRSKSLLYVIIFTLVPALTLDVIYASYHAPKVGHVVPFLISYMYCFFMFVRRPQSSY
jgi:membrane associated rhomboid family serine protease